MLYAAIQQKIQTLKNLKAFLEEAGAFAEAKGFEANNLLQARLAPDMFHLIRQIQSSSDTAKFAAARLSGKDAPRYEDNETTLAELETRLQKTIDYLSGFEASDFAGAAERHVVLPFRPEHWVAGQDYLLQFAQPNFYFHVTTAYNILRHNGVALGKMKFIGHINFQQ